MKIAVVWHRREGHSVAHAYRQSGRKAARTACGLRSIGWPIPSPVDDDHCKACIGALRNLEAKWAADAEESRAKSGAP